MITNQIVVAGLVQGVGFRWMTMKVAKELHVTGTVKNLVDGRVLIVAQADQETMAKFIEKIKASPSPSGYVTDVEIAELHDQKKLHSFTVIGWKPPF